MLAVTYATLINYVAGSSCLLRQQMRWCQVFEESITVWRNKTAQLFQIRLRSLLAFNFLINERKRLRSVTVGVLRTLPATDYLKFS